MNYKSLSQVFIVFFLLNSLTASATTYTVTNTLPTGAGSLFDAINLANANPGMDTINFNIPTAPYSITLSSILPAIVDDIFIDGTTQPGYSSRPIIELTGSGGPGITISNPNAVLLGSHIRGLCINNCGAMGFNINSGKNIIDGCFIGTDTTGTIAKPNAYGIYIQAGADKNIIGGVGANFKNVISGNTNHGIIITSSSQNKIFNNYIGTDASGLNILGNVIDGINISGTSNNMQIGGQSPDSANVISGNGHHNPDTGDGIDIASGSGHLIVGNIIGLDKDGINPIGNIVHGVFLGTTSDCIVGGSSSSLRNVISANGSIGINIVSSPNTVVKGNYIGTTIDGSSAHGNGVHGIQIQSSRSVIIGGDHNTEGNLISASGVHGINLDPGCNQSVIKGNYIGTDITGKVNFGNGVIGFVLKSDSCLVGGIANNEGNIISASKNAGLLLANANHNKVYRNLIGVSADTAALGNALDGINISVEDPGASASYNTVQYNIVAFNGQNGISVGRALDSTRIHKLEDFNNLRFNSIYCNKAKGIFLELYKSTDCGNQCHVAPIINTLQSSSSKIVGVPNGLVQTDSIDIYLMTECINCTSNPQGKIYVATVTPDGNGNWSYDNGSPLAGTMVAMVTDAQGNTSEFSLCYTPCGAKAIATASDSLIDLNHVSEKTVTFTSTSQGDQLSPLPLSTWWILNSKDTTTAFSTNTTASLVFSQHKSTSAVGPSVDTVYLVVKQGACSDTLSFPVTAFFIPNLVTPNGDQKNDKWFVSQRSDMFEAKIYNRWGDLIFSKDGYTDDWDLSSVNDGVYYYYLKDKTGKGQSYKGWVQIVR